MAYADFDLEGLKEYFARFRQAAQGDFKHECELFLEALGEEFLRIVQDEIIRRKVTDTRLLLDSFHRNEEKSVWEFSEDGLLLEVGTNVEYAAYVNNGHWTCGKGVNSRFVPGYWVDKDHFVYDPKAKTGMMLRQQWIDAQPYFDSAFRIMEKVFPQFLGEKLQQGLDKYVW